MLIVHGIKYNFIQNKRSFLDIMKIICLLGCNRLWPKYTLKFIFNGDNY